MPTRELTRVFKRADCLTELSNAKYDYSFFSPPDYEDADNVSKQLGGSGVTPSNPESYKNQFLDLFLPLLTPALGTITIAFTGDRRNNGRILPKNYLAMGAMFELGYFLKSAKYAVKSFSPNLYSSNVIHVLTFQSEAIRGKYNLKKLKLYDSYGRDVWGPFPKETRVNGEVVGQPYAISKNCIEAFSDPGDVVLDPFAGIGTTLEMARRLKRGYVGFEIRREIWEYGKTKHSRL